MNTTDNNKLIAEFMGLPKVPCNIGTEDGHFNEGYKHPKVDVPIIPSGMQYKYSWDWLMPVVEKIEKLGYSYDRINADVFINTQEGKNIIPNPMDYNTMTMLEKTYQVVVEYIKWYNNKTQCNNCRDMMLMLDEECPDCGRTN